MAEPVVTKVNSGTMTLLPPAPDACQTCAVKHPADQPHNPDSLYWATARNMEGKDPPSWELALAHCAREVQDRWIIALGERGQHVDRALMARLAVDEADPEDSACTCDDGFDANDHEPSCPQWRRAQRTEAGA
jgi:hypothetical protein